MTIKDAIEVDINKISKDALNGIIESFILREGTDYGNEEVSFQKKVEQIYKQIEKGLVKVFFEPESETIQLLKPTEIENYQKKTFPND